MLMPLAIVSACGGEPAPVIPFDVSPPGTTQSTTATSVAARADVSRDPVVTAAPATQSMPGLGTTPTADTTTSLVTGRFATASSWANVTSNLAGMESDCGNLTLVSARPDSDQVIAGVARRGLWSLDAASASWVPLGTAPGSATIENRPATILHDRDLPGVFWVAGNYYSNGVYRTDDSGETFVPLGDVQHADAVGVDMTDPGRQTILASIHEQRDLRLSTDGGRTWRSIADSLPDDVGKSNVPHLVDSTTFLLGTWLTSNPGIYRSTDQGNSWDRVFDGKVLELGLPYVDDDGAILWVLHDGGGIIRSVDGGATWENLAFVPLVSSVFELDDGVLVGTTADQIMYSVDGGSNWEWLGPPVPFVPAAFAYSPGRRTFYISHWDCGSLVLPDAVASLSLLPD